MLRITCLGQKRAASRTRLLCTALVLALVSGCQLVNFRDSSSVRPTVTADRTAPAQVSKAERIAARKRQAGRFDTFNQSIRFDPQFPAVVLVIPSEPLPQLTPVPVPEEGAAGVKSSTQPTAAVDAAKPDDAVQQEATELAKAVPELAPDGVIRSADTIDYCKRIDRKLSSVSFRTCLLEQPSDSKFRTAGNNPIYYVKFPADRKKKPLGKVLVLGGVHGDELTSVSIVYLWIKTLNRFHSGLFDWRVAPVVNPDGFFRENPTRTNSNGIDLNRNLPTYQWNQLASRYWKRQASAAERKFPGYQAASESETQWLVNEIEEYQPDVIVTVHAPYNLVDFDAADRSSAPRRLGILRGKSLGTFPGSLGRYAGEERNIPVITLELPHSTRMPSPQAVESIWLDLVGWLRQNINSQNIAGRSFNHCGRSLSVAGCI